MESPKARGFSPEVWDIIDSLKRMKSGNRIGEGARRRMKARLEMEGLSEEDLLPFIG